MLEPGGQHNTVRGYVPRSASGYWVEGVDKHGEVHFQDGWHKGVGPNHPNPASPR